MPDRTLRIAQVIELTGLSRSTIYAMVKSGDFPENHPIGSRAVAWREADVLEWLRDRGVPVDRESHDQQVPDLDEQVARGVRRAFENRNRRIELVREKLPTDPPSGKKRRR
jgi:prophage regulatory protein